MASNKRLVVKCVFFCLLSCHSSLLSYTFIDMAVPLMSLFNKTSGEMVGVYDGGILFLSICSWSSTIATFISLLCIVPLIDLCGRKFICVYIKFFISLASSVFMFASWYFQNSIFYVIGYVLTSLNRTTAMVAAPIYMAEIAPEAHKGFLSASSATLPAVIAGTVMTVLSRQDVFGTEDSWWIVTVISQVINLLFLLIGWNMEDSEVAMRKETISSNTKLKGFFKGYMSKARDVFTRREIGKIVLLLTLIQLLIHVSITELEMKYPMQIYMKEGMTSDEFLTMGLITQLVLIPYYWFGPMIIDKFSRKSFLIVIQSIVLMKAGLHLFNLALQYSPIAYTNFVLHRLVNGSGIGSFPFILASELLPQEFVVIGGQISFCISVLASGIMGAITPFFIATSLPVILSIVAIFDLIVLCAVVRRIPIASSELACKKISESSSLLGSYDSNQYGG